MNFEPVMLALCCRVTLATGDAAPAPDRDRVHTYGFRKAARGGCAVKNRAIWGETQRRDGPGSP